MDNERLTWAEIKKKYPDKYVGLIDVKKDKDHALTAVVKCTEDNTPIIEMHKMAFRGDISLEFTSLDEYMDMGAISL